MRLAAAAIVALIVAAFPSGALAVFPGANGRIAFIGTELTEPGQPDDYFYDIFTILPDGSGVRPLTNTETIEQAPAWSPDGRRIVFSRGNPAAGVYTINADRTNETRVAGLGREPSRARPSFSPSGRLIAFNSGDSLFTVHSDGTDRRLVLTGTRDSPLIQPQFSPTGRRIAFTGQPPGKNGDGIWTVRPNGSGLRRITWRFQGDPSWSPDGRWFVVSRHAPDRSAQLYMIRADGSGSAHLIPDTFGAYTGPSGWLRPTEMPAFAPAGDRVVFVAGNASCADLYTISPNGSDKQRVTDGCGQAPGRFHGDALWPDWQPLPG